jgi:glutamate synthase (ferredoxin)
MPDVPDEWGTYCREPQDHGLEKSLDLTVLLDACKPAIERREKVKLDLPIRNIQRTVGTILSSEITRRHGSGGLPEETIEISFTGSAGQSLMAWGAPGVTVRVAGDVNDYCGKGLCGGKIIVRPPENCHPDFVAEENIIGGNVVLYGATSGELYMRGIAGERFCVRNSGAKAVVEGVGDHGCEYMTGGRAVILGETGRNFAAGMSGGVAYVFNEDGEFPGRINREMVGLEDLSDPADEMECRELIEKHVACTDSAVGRRVLDDWPSMREKFVKIMPTDYKRALAELAREEEAVEEEKLQEA